MKHRRVKNSIFLGDMLTKIVNIIMCII